jgi:uncharacterized protein YgbK (DUF1537 family)
LKGESPFRKEIFEKLKQMNHKLVVLDDDPTGVQTVHDVYVITDWTKDWIREGLQDDRNVLYILTNTRSYEPKRAEEINTEIIRNLVAAANELNVPFSVISRGDSTLRGHYPLEISVIEKLLSDELNWEISGHLIIPAFFEGNRYTAGNTHYLLQNERLVPVNETEFAKDSVFGYSNANLLEYVVEKSAEFYSLDDILTISLDDIREGGVDRVLSILKQANNNAPIVVNAVNYQDLDIVSFALLMAIEQGKHFLFRTAASFVKSVGGFSHKPFLEAKDMDFGSTGNGYGGLLIVGSHTKVTTDQLSDLISEVHVKPIEINVEKILSPSEQQDEVNRVAKLLEDSLVGGHDTVLYTSRIVIKAENKEDNLKYSQTISNTLVELVRTLKVRPKFIMAKGGITSSDIATSGLGIKKAKILGQAVAGVPVLLTGNEARIKNTAYIVFPGNVGQKNTITDIFKKINDIRGDYSG